MQVGKWVVRGGGGAQRVTSEAGGGWPGANGRHAHRSTSGDATTSHSAALASRVSLAALPPYMQPSHPLPRPLPLACSAGLSSSSSDSSDAARPAVAEGPRTLGPRAGAPATVVAMAVGEEGAAQSLSSWRGQRARWVRRPGVRARSNVCDAAVRSWGKTPTRICGARQTNTKLHRPPPRGAACHHRPLGAMSSTGSGVRPMRCAGLAGSPRAHSIHRIISRLTSHTRVPRVTHRSRAIPHLSRSTTSRCPRTAQMASCTRWSMRTR